jgi:hypothetical protein
MLNNGLNGAVERLLKLKREKAGMKQASLKETEQTKAV